MLMSSLIVKNEIIFSLVLLLLAKNLSVGQTLEDEWFGQKWLDENYLFKWKTNHLEKEITIRVEVITKGWVEFGFSKHGKTTEADVVIGWIDDWGHSTFNDYWVNELGKRSLDMSQDWTLLSAEENATHTILDFRRHYVTCDESNDLEIFENDFEMSNINFGYGLIDPQSIETISEPIVQRIFHLNLFESTDIFEPKESDIQFASNWLNGTVGSNEETALCILYRKHTRDKYQIVKFQTLTSPPELQNNHYNLMDCHDLKSVDQFIGQVFSCYDKNHSFHFIREDCPHTKLDTVRNHDPIAFPRNVAITLDPAQNQYIMFEAHLKNPTDHPLEVKLLYKIWFTKQYRKYELGIAALISSFGVYNTWGYIIPPKQPNFKTSLVTSTYCYENDKFDGERGVFIFKTYIHTHIGLGGEIRHYRNDKLTRILRQNYMDNKYQPYRSLKVNINFRRGDKIVGICWTSSMTETKSFTSPHEHCTVVTYYYPVIAIHDEKLYSSRIPYETMLNITGLKQIDGYDDQTYDNQIIRKPVEYNNTKLIDFISENKYEINDPKELEELQISADMMECCYLADIDYAKIKPCQPITKPPGLYQSVISERKGNSCPLAQYIDKNKVKYSHENTKSSTNKAIELFVSFKDLTN